MCEYCKEDSRTIHVTYVNGLRQEASVLFEVDGHHHFELLLTDAYRGEKARLWEDIKYCPYCGGALDRSKDLSIEEMAEALAEASATIPASSEDMAIAVSKFLEAMRKMKEEEIDGTDN